MELKEIAYRLGTDKKHTRHDYVSVYEPMFLHLKDQPIKLLEIGVAMCRSHNMWAEWFSQAKIYGIDIDVKESYNRHGAILENVDQSSSEQLVNYAGRNGPWDIIIDDGSHISSHQITSFISLWTSVNPGGFYIIEDTQFSYWDKGENTIINYLIGLTNHICQVDRTKGKPYSGLEWRMERYILDNWQKTIDSITFRTGMAIIRKRNV